MGAVYKALHVGLGRVVAVKILRPRFRRQRRFEEQFRREARHLAQLAHRHIVEATDFGVETERHLAYLVMEYVDGTNPAGSQPPAALLALADQIASAVDEAHRSGIVHCDLKPANILLTRETGTVKIIDFGSSHLYADGTATADIPELAKAGGRRSRTEVPAPSPVGTPAYMAPELASRGSSAASPASDIYAFGVILYELATGGRPCGSRTAPPTRSSDLPPEWDRALLAPLAVEPAERPATAADTVALLRRALKRHVGRRRRWRCLAAAVVLAVLCALVTAVLEGPLAAFEDRLDTSTASDGNLALPAAPRPLRP